MQPQSTPPGLPALNSPDHPLYPGSQQVFIYALVDPRTDRIRYVGRTRDPQGRLRQHLATARSGRRGDLCVWLRSLLHFKVDPVIIVLDVCHRDHMDATERKWIAKVAATQPDLLNVIANNQYMKQSSHGRGVRKIYHR